ncbi:hypothetical protein GCM10009000_109610 [Halobacterium noricense]
MQHSDEELLTDLHQLADKLGHPPTSTDYREHGTYSLSAYYNHFDSWDQSLQAADLEPPSHHAKIPHNDLIQELTQLADELGDSPTAAQMAEQGAYSPQTYRQRFDSWTSALRAANLDPTTHPNKIPDDDLLDELTQLADKLGETPTVAQMAEQGAYSTHPYQQRFGSWTGALEEAGFERPFSATSKIPRSDLLDELKRVGEAVADPPPSKADIDDQGVYAASTYAHRFGSWGNALEEAGFEPTPPTSKIPRDELLTELTRVADEIDDPPPSQSDMTEHGAYSVWTYKNRFGSWTNAREAAGLDE